MVGVEVWYCCLGYGDYVEEVYFECVVYFV